jgi:putative methionine-R-sulfoxide reductase with GAF domain
LEIKQLSAEVLNAYREINLIHRFSEKLATLLETASVAEAAIAQACEMAKASQGSILLLNEQSGMFEPISSFQGDTASTHGFYTGGGLLGSIAAAGNAEIVSDFPADPRRSRNDPALTSMICDPLKMKDQIRGVLVIGSVEPVTYTAGDMKLLCTLGLQTATAIENTILYEQTIEAAMAKALEQTLREVEEQKQKAEAMLLNILPATVVQELQKNGTVQPMFFEFVTVGFTYFVCFSKSTMTMAAEELAQELHKYFTEFDRIMERYGLEKLKTIGDSYMFVSGLPKRRPSNPVDAVLAAMEMVETVRGLEILGIRPQLEQHGNIPG